jgi:hypothetical protein
MAASQPTSTGLRTARSIVYREVMERARLIAEAVRGLEPVEEPMDESLQTADSSAVDELAPAYELTPRRATGT